MLCEKPAKPALFQSIIDTQFISYECVVAEMQFNRAYDNMRLNFCFSIELETLKSQASIAV